MALGGPSGLADEHRRCTLTVPSVSCCAICLLLRLVQTSSAISRSRDVRHCILSLTYCCWHNPSTDSVLPNEHYDKLISSPSQNYTRTRRDHRELRNVSSSDPNQVLAQCDACLVLP